MSLSLLLMTVVLLSLQEHILSLTSVHGDSLGNRQILLFIISIYPVKYPNIFVWGKCSAESRGGIVPFINNNFTICSYHIADCRLQHFTFIKFGIEKPGQHITAFIKKYHCLYDAAFIVTYLTPHKFECILFYFNAPV